MLEYEVRMQLMHLKLLPGRGTEEVRGPVSVGLLLEATGWGEGGSLLAVPVPLPQLCGHYQVYQVSIGEWVLGCGGSADWLGRVSQPVSPVLLLGGWGWGLPALPVTLSPVPVSPIVYQLSQWCSGWAQVRGEGGVPLWQVPQPRSRRVPGVPGRV